MEIINLEVYMKKIVTNYLRFLAIILYLLWAMINFIMPMGIIPMHAEGVISSQSVVVIMVLWLLNLPLFVIVGKKFQSENF